MQKYWYDAQIIDVYDGDTVTIDIDLGFDAHVLNQKFRLYGVDAPELRGENKEAGKTAKQALKERVLGKEVLIHTIKDKKDKYGRWLCEIWLDGENINQWLIDSGHARIYTESV